MYTIAGHHHISMITKNGKQNNNFYQNTLGLRRVKKTVNQDDPSMYHLFYGDLTGSPGTELSFFEMPIVGRTVRGTNAITQIGLLVPSYDSLLYWKTRFQQLGVTHSELTTYAGKDALHFEDHESLRMVLLNNNNRDVPDHWQVWPDSTIDQEYQILGMGAVELTVRHLNRTSDLLTELFGYTIVNQTEQEMLLQSVEGGSFGEIVLKQQEGPVERPGKGSIHHLALRVGNEEELQYWNEQVRKRGLHSSGIVNRFYFHSLYFRDGNGILFEMATDSPGFTVDSTVEALGKELDLPPFLEARRAEIEARLEPLE